jgi:methyl-accepting chemotaxis protein
MKIKNFTLRHLSLKTQVLIYGLLILILVGAQLYINIRNATFLEGVSKVYKKSKIQQENINNLTEYLQSNDLQMIQLDEPKVKDTLKKIEFFVSELGTHLDKIKHNAYNDDWQAASIKMIDLHKVLFNSSGKIADQVNRRRELIKTLMSSLPDSIEITLLNLKKSLTLKNQGIAEEVYQDFLNVRKSIKGFAIDNTIDMNHFTEAVDNQMHDTASDLNKLLTITQPIEKKHQEVQKLQGMIIEYFSKINELKGAIQSLDYLKEKEIKGTIGVLKQFSDNLKEGVKEDQKSSLLQHSSEIRETKFSNITFSLILLGLFIVFLVQFLRTVRQPLVDLSKTLDDLAAQKPSAFPLVPNRHHEIGKLILSMKKFSDSMVRRIKDDIYKIDDSIEYQLDMVSSTADELSKASVNISKLSETYDNKIKAIHEANDTARKDFRDIVKASSSMESTLQTLYKKFESGDRKNIRRSDIDKLQKELKSIVDAAHKAAIEAQTLGRRINSMTKNNEESEKMAKLFSKAGNKVSVLAQSLKNDTKNFFKKAEIYLDQMDEEDFD